ncbi:MAG: hypothetical protein NTY68_03855 [Candidatus Micrarchaeota archaeon]|nr:hypothetical protein [Candidatus Micrarchaeota archaeon]
MNARLPILAMLLFALCCVSNTASPSWTINGAVTDHLTSMSSIVAVGSMIGMILAVLAYYIAIASSDERGKSGAIGEIKSTLINIFLFAMVIGLILSINSLFSVISGKATNGELISEITTLYENNIINITTVAERTVPFYADVSQLESSSSSVSLNEELPHGFRLGASTGSVTNIPVFGRLEAALASFISTITSIASQQALMVNIMRFFVTISCSLLLPLGFFLRAIPYLRRIGSTLVSIGIALVIIYPISLYVLGSIFIGVQNDAIGKLFPGNGGFNPNDSELGYGAFLDNYNRKVDNLWYITKSYGVIGTINVAYNVYIKGATGIALVVMEFIPFTAWLEKILEIITSLVFPITDTLMTFVTTGLLYIWYTISSANLTNDLVNNGGVENAVHLGMDVATYGTIVNMSHILILASLVLCVLGFIRTIAVLLGGEFFLYGVQELF